MKKKRGARKIASKSKKQKTFFNNKKLLAVSIIAFFVFAFLLAFINVPRASIITGHQVEGAEEAITKIAENQVVRTVFGEPLRSREEFPPGTPLGGLGAVVVHIMVWLILFVAFSDIFGTFMPFTNKFVPWFIGFGMAVIAANFGVITKIVAWSAALTSVLGAFSLFASAIVAFVAFFMVTLLGSRLKVKILKEKWKAASEAGGAKAAIAIENLAKIEQSLERAGK